MSVSGEKLITNQANTQESAGPKTCHFGILSTGGAARYFKKRINKPILPIAWPPPLHIYCAARLLRPAGAGVEKVYIMAICLSHGR